MFSRTITETMRTWADMPARKPLVVRGARQVGKTTAVDLLAREFDQYVREKRQASAEVDFVIQHDNCVVPVEVKSGSSGALRSLHQFMDRCPHEFAVRLYSGPLKLLRATSGAGREFFLLNLPYFLAGKLREYADVLIHDRSRLP